MYDRSLAGGQYLVASRYRAVTVPPREWWWMSSCGKSEALVAGAVTTGGAAGRTSVSGGRRQFRVGLGLARPGLHDAARDPHVQQPGIKPAGVPDQRQCRVA